MAFNYPDEPTTIRAYSQRVMALYAEAGLPFPQNADADAFVWLTRFGYSSSQMAASAAASKHLAELRAQLGLHPPQPGPSDPLLPVRVERGKYRTDAAWLVPRGYTCLSLLHYVKTNPSEAARLLDRAAAARCNFVRFSGMLHWGRLGGVFAGIDFSPKDAGYWELLHTGMEMAQARGLYSEIAFFCDAQYIVPDHATRRAWTEQFAAFCLPRGSVWAQIANEPHKNGWTSAVDPKLLELGHLFKSVNPSTMLSLGDPADEDGYSEDQKVVAEVADYLVLHADRRQTGDRFRWVNHLKGFADSHTHYRSKALLHDEKMGGSSEYHSGRRDNSVVAHVAGATVAAFVGGDNYMHRVEENDGVPGLAESAFLADLPADPSWRFVNDDGVGAPTDGFEGYTKVRALVSGREAWVVAYGEKGKPEYTVKWVDGFAPYETVCNLSDNIGLVRVWKARKP